MNILTTTETADRLGLKPRSVVQLIRRGILAAEKRGRDWFITETEVARYEHQRRTPGRPTHDPDKTL